jgi:putative ABC transport system ATP-binding protein
LNVIGCLDRPTAGRYFLDGREVSGLDDVALTEVRRNVIGFVFQSFHLVSRLTAAGNVELPMIFGGVPRPERQARVAAGLAAVGLTSRADHRPEQLSGGERQRVAIARAMVMRPRVLLADEPTGNLDSASGRQVLDLLGSLHGEGLTLVVVTHDPNVARLAGRVLVMTDGRITRRLGRDEFAAAAGSGA